MLDQVPGSTRGVRGRRRGRRRVTPRSGLPDHGGPGRRLAWLDALRAVAALLVLFEHVTVFLLRDTRAVVVEWFMPGVAGVMLFFLVSGYIIPASLERHGSQRAFWVSRICRLFPLYIVVAVLMVVLAVADVEALNPYLVDHPATGALAHATMLPFLLGVPAVVAVFWTLTFEMIFYLLASGLFVLRIHRASGIVAVTLAMVNLAFAPLTPAQLGGTPLDVRNTTVVTALLLVIGVIAVSSGRRWLVLAGGLCLAGLAGTLLLLNQHPDVSWDGLLIVAIMFVGTAIYRADHGQRSWWQGVLVAVVVAGALMATWFERVDTLGPVWGKSKTQCVVTILVIGGLFAIGMATRRWTAPRFLTWLGLLSYSLYLIHWGLLLLLRPLLKAAADTLPEVAEVPVVAAFLGLLVGICWLTYRFVELPGQQFGKRLTGLLNTRWGSDASIPTAPAPASAGRVTGRASAPTQALVQPPGTGRTRGG